MTYEDLYHGSPVKGIKQFDLAKNTRDYRCESDDTVVYWATDDPQVAKSYANDPELGIGSVYTVNLEINKLFDTCTAECRKIYDQLVKEHDDEDEVWTQGKAQEGYADDPVPYESDDYRYLPYYLNNDWLIPAIQALGYDGLLVSPGGGVVEYGVFDPSQITILSEREVR